jgi:hypothetical protein
VDHSTLRHYQRVAKAFPEDVYRSTYSWTVCMVVAARDDRLSILAERGHWTVRDMRERLANHGYQAQRTPYP